MSRGRRRAACATFVCTSWRARSTLRERSSSTVTLPLPCRDVEVTLRTPSTCITASSRTSTMSCSMTSGAAPSQATPTLIVGKSTSGNWLIPMRVAATPPKTTVAIMIIQAKTGLRIQTSVIFISACRSLLRELHLGAVPQRFRAADHEHLTRFDSIADFDLTVGGAHAERQDSLTRGVVLDDIREE